MTSSYTLNKAAEKILLSCPTNVSEVQLSIPEDFKESVRARVLELCFDCTPNWGIEWVQDSEWVEKRNWYFLDPYAKMIASERLNNIDIGKLSQIVNRVVKDIVDEHEEVSGFGLYGSYFYRRNSLLPEDLDIFMIVKNSSNVTLDALRYEDPDLRKIYKNKAKQSPASQEIGFSIVSEDALNPITQSYIVTDCALLDTSTTLSHWKTVKTKPLPPFLLIQNAQKIIRWWIASILSKPFSLLSRIDEAIRMRKMVIVQFPMISFNKFAIEEMLPSKEDILLGMHDLQLLEISKALINLLSHDEQKIREFMAIQITGNNFVYA